MSTELPNLSEAVALTETQIESFRTNGHILLTNVLSSREIAAYRPHLTETVEMCQRELEDKLAKGEVDEELLGPINLRERNERYYQFVTARRFAKLAAELLGVEGVRIYRDNAIFKKPGAVYTRWHQDSDLTALDTDQIVTIWIPLVDLPAEIGSMKFISGSHKLNNRTESAMLKLRKATRQNLPTAWYGAMNAGDVTFHYGWTLHSANGNPSEITREVITIMYFADRAKIVTEEEEIGFDLKKHLAEFFPGVRPGEVAASPLNPLVYTTSSAP
ncbi:phytanoyl-CoA dioxygenase family protein [Brevibacillus fulvus]|uniref:Ectoine hydroxylase-related dioxygenase (Phytanoyl-CoA dioxygenase family) n=1 Tax=Brevibacillus fulvus TaxID=1125967 RepID=A0A939BTP0_9BACL|nr:phytanoyl-CoA dioxygenase family protein [Brevibacillus fulvus]MBM7589669.1 ectoine hydroxylase-related dioxygenase (phytanoyl-CoA dioxygenase family) [Brevibacillus fulvus]